MKRSIKSTSLAKLIRKKERRQVTNIRNERADYISYGLEEDNQEILWTTLCPQMDNLMNGPISWKAQYVRTHTRRNWQTE